MEPPSFINFHVLELDFPVMTLAQTEWTEVSPMFNTNSVQQPQVRSATVFFGGDHGAQIMAGWGVHGGSPIAGWFISWKIPLPSGNFCALVVWNITSSIWII